MIVVKAEETRGKIRRLAADESQEIVNENSGHLLFLIISCPFSSFLPFCDNKVTNSLIPILRNFSWIKAAEVCFHHSISTCLGLQ
jgi:hypothetical protein